MQEGSHGCLIMGSHFAAAHMEAFVPLNTVPPIQHPPQPKSRSGRLHVGDKFCCAAAGSPSGFLLHVADDIPDCQRLKRERRGKLVHEPLGRRDCSAASSRRLISSHKSTKTYCGRSSEQGGQVPNILSSSSILGSI